jgi:hypothetical protein
VKVAMKKPAQKKNRGPELEVLKLNGNWQDLIKKSYQKETSSKWLAET